jgi:hypothetical protein
LLELGLSEKYSHHSHLALFFKINLDSARMKLTVNLTNACSAGAMSASVPLQLVVQKVQT